MFCICFFTIAFRVFALRFSIEIGWVNRYIEWRNHSECLLLSYRFDYVGSRRIRLANLFDVLSDARSKRIRKRSRMRRNLLLISCNLMLLDLGRAAGSVDIQRNEKEFPTVESLRTYMHSRLTLYGMLYRLSYFMMYRIRIIRKNFILEIR